MPRRKTVKSVNLREKRTEKEYAEMKKIFFYIIFLIITSIAAVDAFSDLSLSNLIIEWDEARHGVNAFEMIKNGNYIVNTYQYATDYWNVKPPLSMWQIVLAYKLLGYNTFSLRFFSALYLPLTVAISMLALNKYVGFICSTVTGFLFATTGTRFIHLFKTGDPDALFFFMCFLACLFLYVAYKENPSYLIGAGLCTAFAFLTKAMHVISLFAVIACYLIFAFKKHRFTVKQLFLYLFIPMAAPVLLWAVLRVAYDGIEFFRQMYTLDVTNRVSQVVDGLTGGRDFYIMVLSALLGKQMFYGIILLVLTWTAVKLTLGRDLKADKAFLVIFGAMALAPIIIFTIPTTKAAWYVFPCMIGVCCIAGYAVQQTVDIFAAKKSLAYRVVYLPVCIAVLLTGGVMRPYNENISRLPTFNMTSKESAFSQVRLPAGTKVFVVDHQGSRADGMPQSWLLQAYFQGLEYVPYGMERYDYQDDSVVILWHTDYSELEEFRSSHPRLKDVAYRADYGGTLFAMLKE